MRELAFAVHFFMKHAASASMNTHIALNLTSHKRQKEGKVMSFCETINSPLETSSSDGEASETDRNMSRLSQTSNE